MKSKKIIALLLAAIMVLALAACGSEPVKTPDPDKTGEPAVNTGEPAGDKIGATVLKCAFNQTIENPEAQTLLDLSDKLYDATEGRYSIEVFPNEQLGSQQESLESVQNGAIEMALVANSIVENVNSDFAIIGCPYIYDSIEHQEKLFASGELDELFATTADNGFNVLCAYSLGSRSVYTRDGAITSPEDLAGLKIRVMQSDTMIQMINYMGGVGTPMGQGDVYSAIQSGILDGAENNIITYTDLLQYEVAPYYSYTNHLMVPDLLCISNSVLSGMSEADQEAFKKVATDSVSFMFNLAEDLRAEYRSTCEGYGVTFTEVDIAPFQENMAPFIEEVAGRSDMTTAIYEAIKSLR